ncbi:flagellar motor switch protein FliM [Tuberibacillus sp. Marseille-P3662]|uniref:flagellar motor switch protein FliM n=1 Tax=Tuberibacillus sp. Marseille-P3662 TaxID=1965358 RepID=UPI000A1CD06E|nr:flagellar motor switch protein FliM [Tuberibacillus sp. Marseille-P3662]
MADVLSQNEIDALLSAISTGEMDAEELKKDEDSKEGKPYDFKRALRFSKDQIRSLTRIHENYARLLTTHFSAQMRTYVEISVASVNQMPYEEFIRSIPSMTVLNIFEAPPLKGRMLFEVNPNIAYAMMDRVLGGMGHGMNKIDKLTDIETQLISQLFAKTLSPFRDAWGSIIEMEPIMKDFEVNAQFLQMVSPNETVVVISLSVTIGEESGMINLCLPHVVLEPIIQKLSMHYWMNDEKKKAPSEGDIHALEQKVKSANISMTALLGDTTLSFSDVLELSVGDVVRLDQTIDDPVTVDVGSLSKFTAQPGKKKQHVAVQILGHLDKEGEEHE